jgi:hypothetical protein
LKSWRIPSREDFKSERKKNVEGLGLTWKDSTSTCSPSCITENKDKTIKWTGILNMGV